MSNDKQISQLKLQIEELQKAHEERNSVNFSLGSSKAREIRDLAAANGGTINARDLKPAYNLADLKLGHLVDKHGVISAEGLQKYIDAMPKHGYGVSFSTHGEPVEDSRDPHGEVLNPFLQRHTPEKSLIVHFHPTEEMMKEMKDKGIDGTFKQLLDFSKQSGHPSKGSAFGWARYTKGKDGNIHIDEIQTDLPKDKQGFFNSQKKTMMDIANWTPEQVELAEKYHPQGHLIDSLRSRFNGQPEEFINQHAGELADQFSKYFPEGHLEQIHNIIFKGNKPQAMLHEGLLQHFRDAGYDGKKIQIFDHPTKAKIALFDQEKEAPGHMQDAYRDVPKRLGYKPAKYGEIETQKNPHLQGKDTHELTLRKAKEDLAVPKENRQVFRAQKKSFNGNDPLKHQVTSAKGVSEQGIEARRADTKQTGPTSHGFGKVQNPKKHLENAKYHASQTLSRIKDMAKPKLTRSEELEKGKIKDATKMVAATALSLAINKGVHKLVNEAVPAPKKTDWEISSKVHSKKTDKPKEIIKSEKLKKGIDDISRKFNVTHNTSPDEDSSGIEWVNPGIVGLEMKNDEGDVIPFKINPDPKFHKRRSTHKNSFIRDITAKDPNLDPSHHITLLNDSDDAVRQSMASNRNLHSGLYNHIIKNGDFHQKFGLALNPSLSNDYVQKLLNDPDENIKNIANIRDHVIPANEAINASIYEGAHIGPMLKIKNAFKSALLGTAALVAANQINNKTLINHGKINTNLNNQEISQSKFLQRNKPNLPKSEGMAKSDVLNKNEYLRRMMQNLRETKARDKAQKLASFNQRNPAAAPQPTEVKVPNTPPAKLHDPDLSGKMTPPGKEPLKRAEKLKQVTPIPGQVNEPRIMNRIDIKEPNIISGPAKINTVAGPDDKKNKVYKSLRKALDLRKRERNGK